MAKKKKEELPLFSFADSFDDYEEDRVVVEDEPKKKKAEFKDSPIGRILHAIKVTKDETLLDDESMRKAFEPFMILRWLSMSNDYCEIVNYVNQLHGPMDKEMVFKLLIELIPKGKTFDPYIKAPKRCEDEDVINIATYYEISQREARTYVKMLGSEWAHDITSRISNSFDSSKKRTKRGKK